MISESSYLSVMAQLARVERELEDERKANAEYRELLGNARRELAVLKEPVSCAVRGIEPPSTSGSPNGPGSLNTERKAA